MLKYQDFISRPQDVLQPRQIKQQEPDRSELVRQKTAQPVTMPKAAPAVYDKKPDQLTFEVLQQNLYNCLTVVGNEVVKEYLPVLQRCEVVPANEEELRRLEQEPVQFFRINELVYQENEFSVDKLATVFNTLSNKPCTLVLMIRSDGQTNNFYLGVRSRDGQHYSTGTMRKMLEQSLLGLFPGSATGDYYNETLAVDLAELEKSGCISSVTCVADYKQEREAQTNKEFIQGLEKFIDSMQGIPFTVVCIANNLTHRDLVGTQQTYEQIYTTLSPFANMQYNYALNNSTSQSQSGTMTRGQTQTHGISSGVSTTQSSTDSYTEGTNRSHTRTDTHGSSTSEADTEGQTKTHTVGASDGTNESESRTNTLGMNIGGNVGSNTSTGISHLNAAGKIGSSVDALGSAVGTLGSAVGTVLSGTGALATGTVAGAPVGAALMGAGAILGLGGSLVGGLLGGIQSESYGTFMSGSAGLSASVARGRTTGTSHTDSTSDSDAKSTSHTKTVGSSESTSWGETEGTSQSRTQSKTTGTGTQSGWNESLASAASAALTAGLSDTFGTSQTVTLNVQNKSLLNTLDRLEQQMDRLDECESIGMWDFAAYFLGESAAEAETAASMYRSLVSGSQSGVQLSAINTWTSKEKVKPISRYITHFVHPEFLYIAEGDPSQRTIVDATTLVSTNELALQLGLPRRSVKGLPVIEHAPFAQEVLNHDKLEYGKDDEGQKIKIGKVSYLGHQTETPVTLDLQSLSMHTFVTGSTGAGKSNAIYKILDELIQKQVKFLVVEPAKGEYKQVFGSRRDVTVLGTNPALGPLLQIDPFSFPPEIHIYEHLDRLVELFNVCWPMYAAMPAVLKDAIERAYKQLGWDLSKSQNRFGERLFPTFQDVLEQINTVMDQSQYSDDNKSDYKGSLCTRLRSLTNGINGMLFTPDELPPELLFDQNVIVDLSRVGSSETKALIMGLLVMKLQEYRMASSKGMNIPLKHLTVLEEAHNLLRKASYEQSSESANLQGKSVEMLTNAIAEMRTYGEGFLIADQAPGMLDPAVIRNTNTKIILRLPAQSDRELVGYAANLNKDQIGELARLPRGTAAIYQNEWVQPILCKIDYYESVTEPYILKSVSQKQTATDTTGHLRTLLLRNLMDEDVLDCHKSSAVVHLRDSVANSRLSARIKVDYLEYLALDATDDRRKYALAALLYDLLDTKSLIADISYNGNMEDWGRYLLRAMPEICDTFSSEQQEYVMLLILHEHKERYPAEKQLFLDFTEFLQGGGRVV